MKPSDVNRERWNIDAAAALARSLGYRVRETDFRDLNAGVVLDVEGFGELVELHYQEHPDSGFLRWKCAYVHRNNGRTDTVGTWRGARALLNLYAAHPGEQEG